MNHPSFSKAAVLSLLSLLAACGPELTDQPAANASANAAEPAAKPKRRPVPSLVGAWTVEKINGAALRQVWPMAVTVTSDEFAIQSECRRFAWKMRQDGNIVQFTPLPVRECARGRSADELQIEDPITLGNIAMFWDKGRNVQITGPGGRVNLARR